MSVLNKQVSYYPSILNTSEGVNVNLLSILESKKHEIRILALRTEKDINKQKRKKEQLPCFTVSGVFKTRKDSDLIIPSGLAAIDLDEAQDYNVIVLMNELKKLPYIAYCGLSCRGQRLYAIIPFAFPDKYAQQYEMLINSFINIGLPMGDECHKKISQPRFVSYNTSATCFYNHEAKQYMLLPPIKTIHYKRQERKNISIGDVDNPFELASYILQKSGNNFEDKNKHRYLFNLCCILNRMGVSQYEAENYIDNHLISLSQISSNCIVYPFKKFISQKGIWRKGGNYH